MKNTLLRKGLVVGIIVLFIRIGFQPALSNEITLPKISDNEEDCDCNIPDAKLHLAEKLLTRLEKNELFTDVNNSIKPQDDRLICRFFENKLVYYYYKMYFYYNLMCSYPEGSLSYIIYFLSYRHMLFMLAVYYGILASLDCLDEPYPPH